MIVIAKHSVTITPTVFELMLSYIRFFIYDRQTKLSQELQRGDQYRVQASASGDQAIPTLQSEIEQAEALVHQIEPAKGEFARIYELNFVKLAEVLRRTRIHLGQEDVEKVYSLKVVLHYLMEMLKGYPRPGRAPEREVTAQMPRPAVS